MLRMAICVCVAGLRGSLSRLQLDYVDIVFANRTDVNAPMEGQRAQAHVHKHVNKVAPHGDKIQQYLKFSVTESYSSSRLVNETFSAADKCKSLKWNVICLSAFCLTTMKTSFFLFWMKQSREPQSVCSWDSLVSLFAEIVRAMTFVIEQGMAMYWGTSRWNVVEIMVTQLTAVGPAQLYSEL